MQNGLAFLSGGSGWPATHNLYDYLLVAYPPREIFEQVQAEKKNFSACHKTGAIETIKPHIAIAGFRASEAMEARLIQWMQTITGGQERFPVLLNNYSSSPATNTVFVRVQYPGPFRQLAASLQPVSEYIQNNGLPPVHTMQHPHISIAKSLQQEVYEKAILDYSRKTFSAGFMVEELVLLKQQNQYDAYKRISILRLGILLN
jgi:2'-5' RNA ligase